MRKRQSNCKLRQRLREREVPARLSGARGLRGASSGVGGCAALRRRWAVPSCIPPFLSQPKPADPPPFPGSRELSPKPVM